MKAALIRGINVGAHAQLPMTELLAMFETAGCRDVRGYLRSGNVVFDASAAVARTLPKRIGDAIAKRYGYTCAVVLRDAAELAAIARANPFARAEPRELHVAFLGDAPTATAIAALDPERSPGDAFRVVGKHIYLHLPRGMGQSKLQNTYFETKLETAATVRNWNTLHKLIEMTSGAASAKR